PAAPTILKHCAWAVPVPLASFADVVADEALPLTICRRECKVTPLCGQSTVASPSEVRSGFTTELSWEANEEGHCGDSLDAVAATSSARHPWRSITCQRAVRTTTGRLVPWLRAAPRSIHERLLLSEAELAA